MKRETMISSHLKELRAFWLLAAIFAAPICANADEDFHPTNDGGNFGLGVELGEPGTWGVTGKLWISGVMAFQPAVKFTDTSDVILQLDCLWHHFELIHTEETQGRMPIYFGIGGNLLLQNNPVAAGRIPVGISYIFNQRNFPVDVYLQAVPTLWFFSGGLMRLDINGELGAHFYL
jgi:hypothetical protein